MFVPIGGRIKIEDLLQGMIIQSGNDACVVLAEGLAGSEEAFVELMNKKAKEIGLADSHFANVDGLPNPDHWMTARDLATLGDAERSRTFPSTIITTARWTSSSTTSSRATATRCSYKDVGADGLKTGHTEEAGYSLTASVKRGDRRIILVLSGLPTMKARGAGKRAADRMGLPRIQRLHACSAPATRSRTPRSGSAPKATVPLTVAKDLVVTLPRKARKDMKVTVAIRPPDRRADQGRADASASSSSVRARHAAGRGAAGRRRERRSAGCARPHRDIGGLSVWGDRH